MVSLTDYGLTLANDQYYTPLHHLSDSGHRFQPAVVADGWSATRSDIWTRWSATGLTCPDQGWKIHISAQLDRADAVLNEVATACFAERVTFKHVSNELFFLLMHHKHANRAQAGKFCALYPRDEPTARRLMDRLAEALAEESGPYILSDRRYLDSRTVHYRFGAFQPRGRQLPEGTYQWLVRDGNGRDRVDRRIASFTLPDGIVDPFAVATAPRQGPLVVHGYEFTSAIAPSNAGGTYQGRDVRTGTTVFIKEARAHNGLYWDRSTAQQRLRRESDVLTALHRAAPGVCPQPLDYFPEWEHEFLVTEFVEGIPLNRWIALNTPVIQANRTAADYAAYYAACARILAALDGDLDRIHALGYRFGDLNPRNIMVLSDGTARLVDFEAASHCDEPAILMGADGYAPPPGLSSDDPFGGDAYAMAAVALGLLMPLHSVVQHRPANLRLLRRDLEGGAQVPGWLWDRATRFSRSEDDWPPQLPHPHQLDQQPRECLEQLLHGVRNTLLAQADPANPDSMFPTSPPGLASNTTCVAFGTAGVVHALHLSGAEVPDAVLARLRREAIELRHELPPGLHFGSAGVGWVLAELGLVEEGVDVIGALDTHPIARRSASLGGGLAGIGLAHLRLHRWTGEQRQLDRAVQAGETILGWDNLAQASATATPSGCCMGVPVSRCSCIIWLAVPGNSDSSRPDAVCSRTTWTEGSICPMGRCRSPTTR